MRPLITRLTPEDPLVLFERFQHFDTPLLLQSAGSGHAIGRYSFLTADPVLVCRGQAHHWFAATTLIRHTVGHTPPPDPELPPFHGGWAGWLGYELGAAFDRMPVREPPEDHCDFSLGLHDWVIAWDHAVDRCWLISTGVDGDGIPDRTRAEARQAQVMQWLETPATPLLSTSTEAETAAISVDVFAAAIPVRGDFSAEAYRRAVAQVVEYIRAGDLFQANLTQRFTAPFTESPVALYRALRERTPAPMSALIGDFGDWIASASPERFLRYDPATRLVETRPIKGTARRVPGDVADTGDALRHSAKDRAENVMIVDLLRNDLARVCDPGSVEVPALCALEEHPTVYHLVSTVTGRLAVEYDALDLLAATFPGGSITGAPKLRAMEILAELEPVRRGVYCGAIGYIGLDGAMDTSIAIRTIVCRDGTATFNAGGGITALSDPAAEYQETLDKAAALVAAIAEAT